MNGMPPENVEQELQSVREDLMQLRNDVRALVGSAVSEKDNKMTEFKDRLCDIGETLKKRVEKASRHAAKACDKVQRHMSDSPVRSVLIALAAGAVLGRLIGGRRA